ncbi:MAG: CPBP family intramembrane metalloprotease [Verrucomicrobiaceae bacterium]|nr:CPBP family intramembrane metalloprotease [Verrucomicrobiaceae bacterium]
MSDAVNIGILQDVTFIAGVMMFFGIIGYKLLRIARPSAAWNHEGQVLSRPYGDVDLLVAVAGMAVLLTGVMQPVAEIGVSAAARVVKAEDVALGVVFQLLMCAVLLMYLSQFRHLNLPEIFGLESVRWRRALLTVLAGMLIIYLVVGGVALVWMQWLEQMAPGAEAQDLVKAFSESDSWSFRLLITLAAVVVAPVVEETLFRGFFYAVLKRYTDAPFAAVVTGLFFAIMHLHVGSLLPLWALAMLLCAAYEFSGCLLVPILLHAVFNGTSIVLMLIGVE